MVERTNLAPLGNIGDTFDMLIAEADLAPQTSVKSGSVARETMESLRVELLTGGLMLELVILAQPHVARKAAEQSTSVVPYHSLTLYACGVHQRT